MHNSTLFKIFDITGTIVRCSRGSLQTLPEPLPPATTALYLDSNDLTAIPAHLNNLKHLSKLDLSFNKIRSIAPNTFDQLANLDTLILSFNSIQCIDQYSFSGLKKLRMLSLYGNNISTIPEKVCFLFLVFSLFCFCLFFVLIP